MFSCIASKLRVNIPRVVFCRFPLPSDFKHNAASACIRFFNRRTKAIYGNIAFPFTIEFIIPCQTIVEVILAAPIIYSSSNTQEMTVQTIQVVLYIAGHKRITAHMRPEIFSVYLHIPYSPLDATPAFIGHFISQVENMADAKVTTPVRGTRMVTIGIAVNIMKHIFSIILYPASSERTFIVILITSR